MSKAGPTPSDSKTVPLSQLGETQRHLTLMVVHGGQVRQVPLEGSAEIVVGRGRDATVVVEDRGLSRRHLCVRVDGGVATVTDLDSSNGTFMRGERIEPNVAHGLALDVPVSAGETKLVVHGEVQSAHRGPYAMAAETTRRMAASLLNVLFVGEEGGGKRHLVRALHRGSPRGHIALVEIDLRTTEFDPRAAKPGSTVLLRGLDILRPLEQDRLASRLGSTRNVRLLGSLRGASADALQPSLRRILGEVEIVIPSVSDLGEELAPIAENMAAEATGRMQLRQTPQFDPSALARLASHRYRDGFRELRAVVDRAIARCDGPVVRAEAIMFDAEHGEWTPEERRERERIVAALQECAGNQSRAAKLLGISRGTLVTRLDKYGLRRPRK